MSLSVLDRAVKLGANIQIARAMLNKAKISIIRAPAGKGKTLTAAIISLILAERGKRIGIFMRTHAEIEHILRMLRNIQTQVGSDLLIIPLIGKNKMCLFVPEEKSILKWWCTISQCYFLNKRRDRTLLRSLIGESYPKMLDYYDIAKSNDLCPYYFYIEAAKEADIIIAAHNYFIDDDLFEKIGKIDVAIIDEAHRFISPLTKSISKKEYELAEMLLSKFKGEREDKIAKKLLESDEVKVVSSLIKYKEYKHFNGEEISINNELIKVKSFSEILKERSKNIEKLILISATFYPEKLYRKIFETEKLRSEFTIIKGLIEDEYRDILVLLAGLSTSFQKRTKMMIEKYVKTIETLSKSLEEPILVFTPNKSLALEINEKIRESIYVSGKDLEELRDICGSGNTNIIFITYARSPLAEGIELNLGECEPRIAVMIGLPYPKLGSRERLILEVLASKIGVKKEIFIEAFLLSDMLSTIVQCLGRVGRSEKGVGIIIDERLGKLGVPLLKMFRSLNSLIQYIKRYLDKG